MTRESQIDTGGPRRVSRVGQDVDDGEARIVDEAAPLLGAGAERNTENPRNVANGRVHSGAWKAGDTEIWIGNEDYESSPAWRRPSVYWLIGPWLLFTLAFGGILVPKLNLIVDLVCHNYFAEQAKLDPTAPILRFELFSGNNEQCRIPAVQRDVATFTLITGVLTGLLSAISAPKLGSLSDRYGRTRMIIVASCGGILNETITILVARFSNVFDYRWLILGAFFDGVFGSFTAGSILGSSYASDTAPPSKRSVHLGYLMACLFAGVAFGPLLAAYLIEFMGSIISIFYVALGCHVAFVVFVFLFTPESLSIKRQMLAREKYQTEQEALAERVRVQISNNNTLSFLGRYLGEWLPTILATNPLTPLKMLVLGGPDEGVLRRNILILAGIDTMLLSAGMASGTIIVLYVEYTFSWGNLEASRFVSFMSFLRVSILLGILPAINYIFRIRPQRRRQQQQGLHLIEIHSGADNLDLWLIRVALLVDVAGTIGYAMSPNQGFFILSAVIACFGGVCGAIVQSTLTKHVPAEQIGALLGAVGLLHALGRVVAPFVFNGIYAATVEVFPQAFFLVLAALLGIGLLSSLFVRPHVYLKESYEAHHRSSNNTERSELEDEQDFLQETELSREALPRT